jgi:hypothetical protein
MVYLICDRLTGFQACRPADCLTCSFSCRRIKHGRAQRAYHRSAASCKQCCTARARGLGGEQFVEEGQGCSEYRWGQAPQLAHQALAINGPDLIEDNEAVAFLKPTGDAPRVGVAARGHGRDDDRAQMSIQFVGRNHDARSRLADLTAPRGIESDQNDVPPLRTYRHSHSSRSNCVALTVSRRASSPAACMVRAASSQPARGARAASMTMRPGVARRTTSSPRPACSRSGRGSRTPCELPIRTMRVFIARCRDYSVITARAARQWE